jgi:hypothetical protein
MIIATKFNNRYISVIAPLGAAAYYTKVTEKKASIVFGLIQKGENGLSAIQRIKKDVPNQNWMSVTARPASQKYTTSPVSPYVSYDFVEQDGNWLAATAVLAAFMQATSQFKQMPKPAPSDLSFKAK